MEMGVLSRRCQYALRAMLELARRYGDGPVKSAAIAEAQGIPQRFLEVILGQLKRAGFAVSERGACGGYALAAPPEELTVGAIIRCVDGPVSPVHCEEDGGEQCPFEANCVFRPMWDRVQQAVSAVYDTTTFQDLVEQDQPWADEPVPTSVP